MYELIVAILLVCLVIGLIKKRFDDPLQKYEPVTDDELLLLTLIDESYYGDLLFYVRTMTMTPALQDYLADKKNVLEALSYYMLLQSARIEQEKKDKWQNERIEMPRVIPHNEKMILQKLKKFQ